MINDEAVEAAAKALFRVHPVSKGAFPWDSQPEGRIKQQFRADARKALEAAAPHMLAEAQEAAYSEGFENGTGEVPWANPYRSQE